MCIRPYNPPFNAVQLAALAADRATLDRTLDEAAADACEHGQLGECDDCNEQRGADMAEEAVGK